MCFVGWCSYLNLKGINIVRNANVGCRTKTSIATSVEFVHPKMVVNMSTAIRANGVSRTRGRIAINARSAPLLDTNAN